MLRNRLLLVFHHFFRALGHARTVAQPQVGLQPGPDGKAVPMSEEVLEQLLASGPDPDGPGVEQHPIQPARHSKPLPAERHLALGDVDAVELAREHAVAQ